MLQNGTDQTMGAIGALILVVLSVALLWPRAIEPNDPRVLAHLNAIERLVGQG
jgi:hypothetical protein